MVLRGEAQPDKGIATFPAIRADGPYRDLVFRNVYEMERNRFWVLDRFLNLNFDAVFLLNGHLLPELGKAFWHHDRAGW